MTDNEGAKTTVARGAVSLAKSQPMTLVTLLLLVAGAYAGWRVLAHLDRSDDAMMKTALWIERMTADNRTGRETAVDKILTEMGRLCSVAKGRRQ